MDVQYIYFFTTRIYNRVFFFSILMVLFAVCVCLCVFSPTVPAISPSVFL